FRERRPPTPPGVAEQRELTDHEGASPEVDDGAIHAPLVVGEDAQTGQFVGGGPDPLIGAPPGHPRPQQQPRADLPHDPAVHRDRGTAHPLCDHPHRPDCGTGRRVWPCPGRQSTTTCAARPACPPSTSSTSPRVSRSASSDRGSRERSGRVPGRFASLLLAAVVAATTTPWNRSLPGKPG